MCIMSFESFKQQLIDAAQSPDADFFKVVLKYNSLSPISKDICTKGGDTILHLAARSGRTDIIRFYAELGNQTMLEQRNLDKKAPLHIAAQSGQLECIKLLLSYNVDVNALKRSDWTPLMLACTKFDLEIVKELVSHNANLHITNKDGWTAFHIASRVGNIDIIKFLIESDPMVLETKSKNERTVLHTVALHGHVDIVRMFHRMSIFDVNAKDLCGITPLMDSVSGNHNFVMKLLLEQGASMEETDHLGKNVLHLASEAGNLDAINYLAKDLGIYMNSQTRHGLTPIHFAAKENKLDTLKLLILLGADWLRKDRQGRAAIKYATTEEVKTYLQSLEQ